MLAEMGFSHAQARKALRETVRGSPLSQVQKSPTQTNTLTFPRAGTQSVPSSGYSRTPKTRARTSHRRPPRTQMRGVVAAAVSPRYSSSRGCCRRDTACARSSRIRARRCTRATMSRTSARPTRDGCSSTTRRSCALTRRACARSRRSHICLYLRGIARRPLRLEKGRFEEPG